MEAQVIAKNHKNYEIDVKSLSFKEANFIFKQTRTLVEMLKSGLNVSHLVKIEKDGFDKPHYIQKIQKDLRVLLILEEFPTSPEYKVTFLRAFRLQDLDEVIEKLDII
jgi:hypothetical protein